MRSSPQISNLTLFYQETNILSIAPLEKSLRTKIYLCGGTCIYMDVPQRKSCPHVLGTHRRPWTDVDGLWQTVQPGPFSEKQAQWLTLPLCLVTVGVTEWTECNRLYHLCKQMTGDKLTPGSVLGPLRGRHGNRKIMIMMILIRSVVPRLFKSLSIVVPSNMRFVNQGQGPLKERRSL